VKAGQWIRIGILTALCAGLIFFVIKYGKQFFQALHPLGFGIIIAYILLPLVETLDRLKVSRTISILTSFILSMIIISVVLLMIIPIFVDNIKELTAVLPGMFDEAFKKVEIFIKGNIPSSWQPEILKEVDNSLIKIQDSLTRAMYNFITSLPGTISFVLDVLLGWILSFYILKDKEQLVSGLKYFFPKSIRGEMVCFFRDIHRVVLRFIQGQVLIAIIISIIETLGLYLIGMPYATLLGFIGGMSNIIPYFGPYIGAIPALAVALTISPWKALWTAAVFFVVQQLDNIYLSPRIMEGKLRLHPVVTMLAVIVGGKMFGVWGLLFGVPLVAMLKVLLKRVHRIVAG
jgi:predicted PurR-regulated permease PerM